MAAKRQTRSETVTVRLDPKLKYGLELLARKQYRSVSSVVEWLVNNAIRTSEELPDIDYIWDIGEADRLINLAFADETMLTFEEQLIWKVIKDYDDFWIRLWDFTSTNLYRGRVRDNWEQILKVANGEAEANTLKLYPKTKTAKVSVAVDDEIPF
ncbi:MAG: hypothetical protein MRY32_01910 [Rickettsiales bacterium]|nr:hypothetical protein [Rickettsiales bacterium]